MAITVSLWSRKTGEIKRFLERYYEKEVFMDEDVSKWIYVYNKPLEAVDIISTLIDNNDKYEINICLQVDNGDLHTVTYENHNDIIKGIFYLFYEECPEEAVY
ncbi:MAG: hypothetical protein N2645_10195 [Clostridia bacterium]|nr:hypothetical protein [Clostridia bacterium]